MRQRQLLVHTTALSHELQLTHTHTHSQHSDTNTHDIHKVHIREVRGHSTHTHTFSQGPSLLGATRVRSGPVKGVSPKGHRFKSPARIWYEQPFKGKPSPLRHKRRADQLETRRGHRAHSLERPVSPQPWWFVVLHKWPSRPKNSGLSYHSIP